MLRALYAGLALPTGTIREPRRVRPMRSNAEDGAPNERLPKRARTGSTHVCHDSAVRGSGISDDGYHNCLVVHNITIMGLSCICISTSYAFYDCHFPAVQSLGTPHPLRSKLRGADETLHITRSKPDVRRTPPETRDVRRCGIRGFDEPRRASPEPLRSEEQPSPRGAAMGVLSRSATSRFRRGR